MRAEFSFDIFPFNFHNFTVQIFKVNIFFSSAYPNPTTCLIWQMILSSGTGPFLPKKHKTVLNLGPVHLLQRYIFRFYSLHLETNGPKCHYHSEIHCWIRACQANQMLKFTSCSTLMDPQKRKEKQR